MLLSPSNIQQVFIKEGVIPARSQTRGWIEKPIDVKCLQNHCLPAEGMVA